MSSSVHPAFGGQAVVYCIHDRVKGEVTDLGHVGLLGLEAGQLFNPAQHKVHRCPCCDNLFVRLDDVPHYCPPCSGRPVHPVGGPIPEPQGVV